MYQKDVISSIIFIVIFALALLNSSTFPEMARMFPRIICIMGLGYSCIILARAVFRLKRGEEVAQQKMTGRELSNILITLAAGFTYVAIIPLLGYMTTTFLFLTAFSFYLDRTYKKYIYILFGGGFVLLLYLAFAVFLTIPLPKGILF